MAFDHAPGEDDRPLLPEELAQLPDIPASEPVPQEITNAHERLYISGLAGNQRLGDLLRPTEDGIHNVLQLPEGARIGRPGRSLEHIRRADHDLPNRSSIEGVRPPWVSQTVQPRVTAAEVFMPPMRTIDGRNVRPHEVGVYPPDDRKVYYPKEFPWQCVGRIFVSNNWAGGGGWKWAGSGVLVGPRHVLTASHVCPWGATSWAMLFVASCWDNVALVHPGESYVSDARSWVANVSYVSAHDVAVLRLYDPIGSGLGSIGVKTYNSAWQGGPYWNQCGYPAAIAGGQRPCWEGQIAVLDDDRDGNALELEHHGDSTQGASGGPLFGWWGGYPYAVGALSGYEGSEDYNLSAGGQEMVDLVLWALSQWT